MFDPKIFAQSFKQDLDEKNYETLLSEFQKLALEEKQLLFQELEPTQLHRLFQTLPLDVAAEVLQQLPTEVAVELLKHLDPSAIEGVLQKLDKQKTALLLRHLDESDRHLVLQNSPPAQVADYLEILPNDLAANYFQEVKPQEAKEILQEMRTEDAVQLIQELPAHLRDDVIANLHPKQAADILEDLPSDIAAAAVMEMDPKVASAIVQEMRSDDEADLLQEVSPEHAEQILQYLEKDDAERTRELLAYDEDTAGGLMQKEYIALPHGLTAREVVDLLRERAEEYAEYPASYLYVIDEQGRLDGVISLRALLLCKGNIKISSIMSTDVRSVPVSMPGEEIVKIFRRTHYFAIPVVSLEGTLLGIVTQDDALRYAEEDADEELLRFAGIMGGEDIRETPVLLRSWKRLVWLTITLGLNFLAVSIISFYESTLQAIVTLAVFMPIISDMGGCSGNQSVAVSIQAMSMDRIRPRDFLRVLWTEIPIGLINGFVLGSFIALIAWLWKGNAPLGLVLGLALWVNSVVSVSVGSVIPLFLRYFNFDPAIASSLLLTKFTDMCGFFLVLTLATQVLLPMLK